MPDIGSSPTSSQNSTSELSQAEWEKGLSLHSNKRLAEFMALDPEFWIFRRFDRLNLFNIINLQQRLGELERQLDTVVPRNPKGFKKQDFELLMPEIESTLKKYEDALVAQARRKAFPIPTTEKIHLIEEYCLNGGLQVDHDIVFGRVGEQSEQAAIAAGERGWIHKLIETYPRLRKTFETKQTANRVTKAVLIVSEATIRRVEKGLISLGFCILLLAPIAALYYLENKSLKLGIVLIFILALSTLTIDLTESTNKTGVTLVAGYSAILVVFLSTTSST